MPIANDEDSIPGVELGNSHATSPSCHCANGRVYERLCVNSIVLGVTRPVRPRLCDRRIGKFQRSALDLKRGGDEFNLHAPLTLALFACLWGIPNRMRRRMARLYIGFSNSRLLTGGDSFVIRGHGHFPQRPLYETPSSF